MWNFILTDLSLNPVGEILNASDRSVTLPLNKIDTLSFRIRIDHPLASVIASTRCYIKAYRDGVLKFFGPVLSVQESAERDVPTLAVNAVGGGWFLQKRLAGKSITGRQFTSLTDRAQICATLINAAGVESDLSIRSGLGGPNSAASMITYTAGPYRPILEIIQELAASLDGFDWRIVPLDGVPGGVGTFYARPVIGTRKPEAIFEYGTGRHNVESYNRTISRDTQADVVYHVSTDAEAGITPVVSSSDAAAITDWTRLEDLATADLADAGMRQNLTDEHVRVRKNPRQVIQFTPHIDPQQTGRLPELGTDFDIGDWVTARAVYNGVVHFDAWFRVWGVSFAIDAAGTEKMSLTLVEE